MSAFARGFAVLLAWLLAGCATSALPPREPVPEEARFDSEAAGLLELPASGDGAGGSAGPAQRVLTTDALHGDWWKVFRSASLDAVVTQSLRANRTVGEAVARLEAAAAELDSATAQAGPQADLAAGSGREKYGAQFLGPLAKPPPFTYFAVGPVVSYQVDLAGGVAHGVARQRALVDLRRHQLAAARLALTGNVTREVIQVAALEAQIATAENLLAQDREALRLSQVAVQLGTLAQAAVLPAQASLAQDLARLPPLRMARARARHALAVLLGQPPGEALPPLPALADLELPLEIPVGVPSRLAHRRPDILAAEAQLDADAEALGVADANLYPQLTLAASTGLQSTDPGHFFNPASSVFSLAAAVSAPLWDGGRLRAGQRAAAADLRASSALYQRTVLQAFGQVADALSALDQDGQALTASSLARTAAAGRYDAARRARREGSGTLPEQLDAQRAQLRSELDWEQAAAHRYQDTAELLLALGGSGEESFRGGR